MSVQFQFMLGNFAVTENYRFTVVSLAINWNCAAKCIQPHSYQTLIGKYFQQGLSKIHWVARVLNLTYIGYYTSFLRHLALYLQQAYICKSQATQHKPVLSAYFVLRNSSMQWLVIIPGHRKIPQLFGLRTALVVHITLAGQSEIAHI